MVKLVQTGTSTKSVPVSMGASGEGVCGLNKAGEITSSSGEVEDSPGSWKFSLESGLPRRRKLRARENDGALGVPADATARQGISLPK